MADEVKGHVSQFAINAADMLAVEVSALVRRGMLDSRSPAADAVLEYALTRFGSSRPIEDLHEHVEKNLPPRRR